MDCNDNPASTACACCTPRGTSVVVRHRFTVTLSPDLIYRRYGSSEVNSTPFIFEGFTRSLQMPMFQDVRGINSRFFDKVLLNIKRLISRTLAVKKTEKG